MPIINEFGDSIESTDDAAIAVQEPPVKPAKEPTSKKQTPPKPISEPTTDLNEFGDPFEIVEDLSPERELFRQEVLSELIASPDKIFNPLRQGQIASELIESFEDPKDSIRDIENKMMLGSLFKVNPEELTGYDKAMLQYMYDDPLTNMKKRFQKKPLEGGYFTKMGEAFKRGNENISSDIAMYEAVFNGRGAPQQVLKAREKMLLEQALSPIEGNFVSELFYKSAQIVPGMIRGFSEAIPEATTGMAAGATVTALAGQAGPQIALPEEIITVPAGAIIGFKAGLSAGSAHFWYKQGAGSMAAEMLTEGYDIEISRQVAGIAAIPYSLIELSQVAGVTPGLRTTIKTALGKTVREVLGKAVKKYGTTLTKEVLQEVAQEIITISASDISGILSDADIEFDADYIISRADRIWETTKESAQAMALLPVPGTAIDVFTGTKAVLNKNQLLEINSKLKPIPVLGETTAKLSANTENILEKVENVAPDKDGFRTIELETTETALRVSKEILDFATKNSIDLDIVTDENVLSVKMVEKEAKPSLTEELKTEPIVKAVKPEKGLEAKQEGVVELEQKLIEQLRESDSLKGITDEQALRILRAENVEEEESAVKQVLIDRGIDVDKITIIQGERPEHQEAINFAVDEAMKDIIDVKENIKGQLQQIKGVKPISPDLRAGDQVEIEGSMKTVLAKPNVGAEDDLFVRVQDNESRKVTIHKIDEAAPKIPEEKRIISKDAFESARARMKERRGKRLTAGIDPADLVDATIAGGYLLETGIKKTAKGVVEFGEWSKEMIKNVGDWVKPHLQKIWSDVQISKETDAALMKERQELLAIPPKQQTTEQNARLDVIESELVKRNLETFPILDISDKKRKSEQRRVETQIEENPVYQATLEGVENIPDLSGSFNVDSTEIGDVKARFEGRPDILKKFILSETGGFRWDEGAGEIGIDNINDFMDMVEVYVDSKSGGKINPLALNNAINSGDPGIALLAMKAEMLQAGFSAAEINEEMRKLAVVEQIPENVLVDELLEAREISDVETKQLILRELDKKAKQAEKKKAKPKGTETEKQALSRARTRANKEGRPIYISEKNGKFSLSKNQPRKGDFIKVTPPEKGQVAGTTERLSTDPTNIDVEQADNNLKQPQNRTQTDEWYEANLETYKKSILEKGTDIAKKTVKEIDKKIGVTSTRLFNIAPELYRRTRRYVYNMMTRTSEMNKRVEPFQLDTKKMSKSDLKKLDLAMKNSDTKKIEQLIKENDMQEEYDELRKVLNEIYEAAKQVGIDIDYRKSYVPRIVNDPKGFLEHFQKGDDWSIIREAINKKEIERGRILDDTERAAVVNSLLRGYTTSALSLASPGASKERTVDVIDAEVNQFYDEFRVSIGKYISGMNEKIASREFFGRQSKEIVKLRGQLSAAKTRLAKLGRKQGLTPGAKEETFKEHISKTKERMEEIVAKLDRLGADDLSNTIGQFVIDEVLADNIKPSQEKEVRDLLQGLFDPKGSSKLFGDFKALMYIDVLGNFFTTITQLEELGLSFYRSPMDFVPSLVKATLNMSEITTQDLGITSIGADFTEADSRKALSAILSITGFEKIDRLGKQTFINTALASLRKQAKNPKPAFTSRLKKVFGDEYQQTVDDLKSGAVTDNVKYLVFNQVMDIQPLALSEMPEAYNRAGNGRIFYALRTFVVKQLDFFRTEVFHEMKSTDTFMRGFGRLIWLSTSLALFGAGADALKDFLRGRPFDLWDSVIDSFMRRVFFSKFQYNKAMREGFGRSFLEGFIPPTKTVDAITKDIVKFGKKDVKDYDFWRSIPIVGEPYFWWFGRGKEVAKKEKRKSKRGKSKR